MPKRRSTRTSSRRCASTGWIARASGATRPTPRLRVVGLQVLFALACIIGGACLFVGAVDRLATALGVSEILLALVIAPIATELPEKFNSLIWVRQGKDTLAMGNITGAMVFQSAIPTVVALVLAGDAWHVNEDSLIAFLSAGIAFIAVAAIFGPMGRRGPPRRPLAARRRGAVPRVPRDRRASPSRACRRSADPGRAGRPGSDREGAESPDARLGRVTRQARRDAARHLEPTHAHPAAVRHRGRGRARPAAPRPSRT